MPAPKKIVYIISQIDSSLEFEWVAERLDRRLFDLSFILMNPGGSPLEDFIKAQGLPVFRVPFYGKKSLPSALFRIVKLLARIKPHTVHAHLFEAGLAGLLAAKICRVPQRVYTRHHSSWHWDYFPHMVKYDRFINRMATDLVAISGVVKEILVEKEKADAKKVHIIHHGIEFANFQNIPETRTQALRDKYGLNGCGPVVGVISRYTHWKGIQYIVPAFQKYLADFPSAKLLLANAKGEYAGEIKKMLSALPAGSYREITFEKDLYALYTLLDMFVHVPINKHAEAFGQIYIEALAAKVPSIFTLSGIAGDFVEHKKHAWVAAFEDSASIYEGMMYLSDDKNPLEEMKGAGAAYIEKHFTFGQKLAKLQGLYQQK